MTRRGPTSWCSWTSRPATKIAAILLDVVRRTAEVCFMPLTVGGGIRSLDDIRTLLSAGADKVSINSAAVRDPELVRQAARRFGSQCIVVNIDPKRVERDGREIWEVHINGGRVPTGREAVSWAREVERLGAGEIVLTSMDADGTKNGYDLEMTRAVVDAVDGPGGGLRRGGQPRAPARRPGRGGRQRGPGREHFPLPALFHRRDQRLPGAPRRAGPARRTPRSPSPRSASRSERLEVDSARASVRESIARIDSVSDDQEPVRPADRRQSSSPRKSRSARPWRPSSKHPSKRCPTSPKRTSSFGW